MVIKVRVNHLPLFLLYQSIILFSSGFDYHRATSSARLSVVQKQQRPAFLVKSFDKGLRIAVTGVSRRCTGINDAPHQSQEVALNLEWKNPLKVGIIGAGSIAFGTAALLSSLGHDPVLWSPSGAGTHGLIESALSQTPTSDETIFSSIQSDGAISGRFNVRLAQSPGELVRSSDNVLVVALPVNGHKHVMDLFAPEIVKYIIERKVAAKQNNNMPMGKETTSSPIIHIIISSHASLGAVYFLQILKDEYNRYSAMRKGSQLLGEHSRMRQILNTSTDWLRITAWGTTVVTARKTSTTSVNVLTIRQSIDFCTVPSNPDTVYEQSENSPPTICTFNELLSDGYCLCQTLFGKRFKHRKGGLLAISLSNLNPQNHLGIVLGNMSRMDPPPLPPPLNSQSSLPLLMSPTSFEPWYQGQNITPNVGRLMEALDRERIDIALELDIEVRTIYQHFSWSFHVPLETPILEDSNNEAWGVQKPKTRPLTVSEMNQQMHYYLKNDVFGPSRPDSRYVLEDVPYGLVLIVILGRLLNRPAVLHEAGIKIVSAMYGRDFMKENDILQELGLINDGMDAIPSLDIWKEMAYTGYFKRDKVIATPST